MDNATARAFWMIYNVERIHDALAKLVALKGIKEAIEAGSAAEIAARYYNEAKDPAWAEAKRLLAECPPHHEEPSK